MNMVKRILIPIDFNVASLNTLKIALEKNRNVEMSIVLFYSEYLGDSISDLLFYNEEKAIKEHLTSEFQEGIEVLRNHFQFGLENISFKILQYNRIHYFKAMLETLEIDEIYVPGTYELALSNQAFNPIPLIEESGLPVHQVYWECRQYPSERSQLTALFNSTNS